jgi:hypothetical protein
MYARDPGAWLNAHERLINPKKGRTYIVKRKPRSA